MEANGTAAYARFLREKAITAPECGFEISESDLPDGLFVWQKRVVRWACRRGRAALWADTGLGKTAMQLGWAQQVAKVQPHPVLILAPLAVSGQTQREGEKFGIEVTVCRDQSDVRPGVNVTNYERLDHFHRELFGGMVCDEASILKGDGPLRKGVCAFAEPIPYRLAPTATPAPNDTEELINQAEFLGIMRGTEILALYFTQDGNTTHKWRLKGHARQSFWKWLSSWAAALRRPSDLGYPDDGYDLPPLRIHQHTVETDKPPRGALFQAEAFGIQEQRKVRRDTLEDRVKLAASMVNGTDEPFVFWCELNAEQDALEKHFSARCFSVHGTLAAEEKERRLWGWLQGERPILISKPSVCGFGLNLQRCHRTAFVGLGNSYEMYYQAIRRFYRFGQQHPVDVHVITSEADGPIVRNIERKSEQAREMMDQLIAEMGSLETVSSTREDMEYETNQVMRLPEWLTSDA